MFSDEAFIGAAGLQVPELFAETIPEDLLQPPPYELTDASFCCSTAAFEFKCDELGLAKFTQALNGMPPDYIVVLLPRVVVSPANAGTAGLSPPRSSPVRQPPRTPEPEQRTPATLSPVTPPAARRRQTLPDLRLNNAEENQSCRRPSMPLVRDAAKDVVTSVAAGALSFRHNVVCEHCGIPNSMCFETDSNNPWRTSVTSNRQCFNCAHALEQVRWQGSGPSISAVSRLAWTFHLLCPAPFVEISSRTAGGKSAPEARFALARVVSMGFESSPLKALLGSRCFFVKVSPEITGGAVGTYRVQIPSLRKKFEYLDSAVKFAKALQSYLASAATSLTPPVPPKMDSHLQLSSVVLLPCATTTFVDDSAMGFGEYLEVDDAPTISAEEHRLGRRFMTQPSSAGQAVAHLAALASQVVKARATVSPTPDNVYATHTNPVPVGAVVPKLGPSPVQRLSSVVPSKKGGGDRHPGQAMFNPTHPFMIEPL